MYNIELQCMSFMYNIFYVLMMSGAREQRRCTIRQPKNGGPGPYYPQDLDKNQTSWDK